MEEKASNQANPTLAQGWQQFATYDKNANQLKNSFHRLEFLIITLGVLATLLVLLKTQLIDISSVNIGKPLSLALKFVIIITPITISVLIAYANRFKSGNKWIILRGTAEAIKSEIYRFRTLGKDYNSDIPAQSSNPDERLAQKIAKLCDQLMQTEVNQIPLLKYKGTLPPRGAKAADDEGFKPLTAEQYIEFRLKDQSAFYEKKTKIFGRRLKLWHGAIYIAGGLGTFLAAIGVELWVALATGIAAAFTTYMEYRQLQNTLMLYNQAHTSLNDILLWWGALPEAARKETANIQKIVSDTENILITEQVRWIQHMENALKQFYAEQAAKEEEKKKK